MRFLISTVLVLLSTLSARADEIKLADVVKASLVFQDDYEPTRHYPHVLKIFLRLENTYDSDVSWVANLRRGIEADVLDASGNPVPQAPGVLSIQSNPAAYKVPFGSRLDWLISGGGISFLADPTDKYAVVIGSRGWLIPTNAASSYSLRVRLRGLLGDNIKEHLAAQELKILLDIPPTRIEIVE